MLKRRVAAIEKRLGGLNRPTERPLLVFSFGDGTGPPGKNAETEGENDSPIVFKMPRPNRPEEDRIFRFDFGSREAQSGQAIPETRAATDSPRPPEGEKK
jgi:hypothetical protein